jgi:hypothetical protein
MVFAWSQLAGPAIPDMYLAGTSSQVFVPGNVLQGGQSYVIALRVHNSGDASQSAETTLNVNMLNSPLRSSIAGGASFEVSTTKQVNAPGCIKVSLSYC